MKKTLISALALAAYASPATADIQIECGPLSGHGYYAEENLVSEGEGGWSEDKISGGASVITIKDDGEVLYSYKDATGVWTRAEEEGGATQLMSVDNDLSIVFSVQYSDQAIELVTIAEFASETPIMLLLSSRNGPAFTSSKIMKASCVLN